MLVVTLMHSDIQRERWSLCQKALTHIFTHTHTGRIRYESIAALPGCVPAVTALMLAATDGSVQPRLEQNRVTKRRRQKPEQYRGYNRETSRIMIEYLIKDIVQANK